MEIPKPLQLSVDACLNRFKKGDTNPSDLEPVLQWIDDNGWDKRGGSSMDDMYFPAIDLDLLWEEFNDPVLRGCQELDDAYQVKDADRTRYARALIKRDYDGTGPDLMCLETYPIQATDGSTAFIGCITTFHGQYGDSHSWCGLWKSQDEFLASVEQSGQYWIPSRMEDVTDDAILSRWDKDPLN